MCNSKLSNLCDVLVAIINCGHTVNNINGWIGVSDTKFAPGVWGDNRQVNESFFGICVLGNSCFSPKPASGAT